MLAFADVVVGKEVHFVGEVGQGAEEGGGGGDVRLRRVDLRDEGDADPVRDAEGGDEPQVIQDQFVGDAGVALVRGAVHHFEVHQEEVGGGGDGADDVRGGVKRRVHGAVEAATAQFGQQFLRVGGVHQRFAATEGDASAAVGHHAALLLHLVHQLVQGPFAAADFHREGGAGVGAGAAGAAGPPGGADALRGELERPLRAGLHAGGAADAFG